MTPGIQNGYPITGFFPVSLEGHGRQVRAKPVVETSPNYLIQRSEDPAGGLCVQLLPFLGIPEEFFFFKQGKTNCQA